MRWREMDSLREISDWLTLFESQRLICARRARQKRSSLALFGVILPYRIASKPCQIGLFTKPLTRGKITVILSAMNTGDTFRLMDENTAATLLFVLIVLAVIFQ